MSIVGIFFFFFFCYCLGQRFIAALSHTIIIIICFLKRNLKIKSSAVKSHAYKAFVIPTLEYASAVWDPHTRTQINQIEKVQRRAARYVTNRYHNTSSVTDMLHNLNWPSLDIRRTRVRLIMFYKIIHHVVAIHPLDTLLLPTTTITRYNSSHTYQHIRTDKDSYKYSFYPRTIIQWNLLPIHVHEAVTVDAFKALRSKSHHSA